MAPPLVVVGSVVLAAGASVAFYQFVYEPHIAPKLEVMAENWLERRRARRRQAAAYRVVAEEPEGETSNNTGPPGPFEMDTMQPNLAPEATLRRRVRQAGGVATPATTSPELPLISLEGSGLRIDQPRQETAARTVPDSRSSTPSTVPSSILDTTSPNSPAIVPDRMADSILSDRERFRAQTQYISPAPSTAPQSPTRGLQVNLRAETVGSRQQSIHYPDLASPRLSASVTSTVYESLPPSSRVASPLPQATASSTVDTIRSPFSDYVSLSGHRPSSSASWVEDDDHFLAGSDAESWASMNTTTRRTK